MEQLRILYDFEAFTDQSHGGISRYVIELASHLANTDGCEVILCAGWHRNEHLRKLSDPWIRGRFLPAIRRTGELRRRMNALFTKRAILDFQPDLVHRSYHRYAADYVGPHKTVVTIHDLTYFHYPESFPGGEIVRRRLRKVARNSDHALCDSENTRKDAIRLLPISPERTSVVHLGVNLPAGIISDTSRLQESYLLYVGQRSGYKNFGLVLEALSRLNNLGKIPLIAFGGGNFSSAEQAKITRLGLQDRVKHQTGDDTALAGLYRHATALVYPSLYEGFGLPLLEAMAHGCPVICSDRSSLPEVAGDAALFFCPEDADALRAAISKVISDSEIRYRLIKLGLERAREFSWESCAAKTLNIYRSLTGKTETLSSVGLDQANSTDPDTRHL